MLSDNLPLRFVDTLYHVGSLDPAKKGEMSWEGMGLSVSLHPAAWMKIGRGLVQGDVWQLDKFGGAFLDIRSLDATEKAAFTEWGRNEGYLTDLGYGMPAGTNKLFSRVGMIPNHSVAFSFALTVFVEEHTGLDGVWWEEPLSVKVGGSAPRAAILPSRIVEWEASLLEIAPDMALLSRNPAKRIPPPRTDVVERRAGMADVAALARPAAIP